EPTVESTKVADRNFGPAAGLDYDALVLDWCDWHARGIERGIATTPRVRVFVMGANRWRDATEWPLPGTTPRTLYLRAGRRLTSDPPEAAEEPETYTYNPSDPV